MRWELTNPAKVKDFVLLYNDADISLTEIAKEFDFSNTETARNIAHRLGLPPRPRRFQSPTKNQATTAETLRVEREQLAQKMREVDSKLLDLEVRVERNGADVLVYGLKYNFVLETTIEYAQSWLDGGGPAKLRAAVGKQG